MSKINKEDLEDYRFYVTSLYQDYIDKTEKRSVSYGEYSYLGSLTQKELEDLHNEILEELGDNE